MTAHRKVPRALPLRKGIPSGLFVLYCSILLLIPGNNVLIDYGKAEHNQRSGGQLDQTTKHTKNNNDDCLMSIGV